MFSLLIILSSFQVGLGFSPISILVSYSCAMVQKLMPTLPVSQCRFLNGHEFPLHTWADQIEIISRVLRNVESIQMKVVVFTLTLQDATYSRYPCCLSEWEIKTASLHNSTLASFQKAKERSRKHCHEWCDSQHVSCFTNGEMRIEKRCFEWTEQRGRGKARP